MRCRLLYPGWVVLSDVAMCGQGAFARGHLRARLFSGVWQERACVRDCKVEDWPSAPMPPFLARTRPSSLGMRTARGQPA